MMPADRDVKAMIVSGCRVRLAFSQTDGRWSVEGTVACGLAENSGEQTFETGACATREEAEQEALGRVAGLLGSNVDRNTARVKNWS
jgi:hypothetical protein